MMYSGQFLILSNDVLAAMGAKRILDLNYPDSFVKAYSEVDEFFKEIILKKNSLPLAIIFNDIEEYPELPVRTKKIIEKYPEIPFLYFIGHTYSLVNAKKLNNIGVHGLILKTAKEKAILNCIQEMLTRGGFIQRFIKDYLETEIKDYTNIDINPFQLLSKREREILKHFLKGERQKTIANILGLNQSTIATYHSRLKEKLNVSTTKQLLELAKIHSFR